MWKFIIIAIAVYFLYRLFANDFGKKQKQDELDEKKEREKKLAEGKMARDPECGEWVDKEDALTVRDGDKVSYFCSYDCRDRHLKKLEAARESSEGSHD